MVIPFEGALLIVMLALIRCVMTLDLWKNYIETRWRCFKETAARQGKRDQSKRNEENGSAIRLKRNWLENHSGCLTSCLVCTDFSSWGMSHQSRFVCGN